MRPVFFVFTCGLMALQVAAQAPLDSLYKITEMWHDLPSAEVSAVGLAAGAQRADEVAGALTVLSKRELERFQYADPMQALRAVAGVNLQEEDGFGLRPNIGLRGSGTERSARITLMEDGVLAAPAPYAAPAAYYFPTVARMSSIEVMKGSSQIAFGPSTSGGALNLISTAIPTQTSAVNLRLEAGSFQGRRTQFAVGGTRALGSGTWGYLMEYVGLSSDGFKELETAETGFQKEDRLVKLRWTPREGHKEYVQLKWGDVREMSHETYLGLTDSDFAFNPLMRYAGSSEDVMEVAAQQMSLTHSLQRGQWDWETCIYRNAVERNWYKLDRLRDSTGTFWSLSASLSGDGDSFDAVGLLNGRNSIGLEQLELKANNRSYHSMGIQHRGGWNFQVGQRNDWRFTYGLRVHRDGVDRFEWRDGYAMHEGMMQLVASGTPGTAGNRLDGAEAFAGYARLIARAGGLTFSPGLRHERIAMQRTHYEPTDASRESGGEFRENRVNVWLPGMGVHWSIREDMNAFAGLHRGFIPPGSAPDSEPEQSWNAELGFRLSRQRFSLQITAFHTAYQNLLGSDLTAVGGEGSGDMHNGGGALAQGLELEWAWDPLSRNEGGWSLPMRGTYTFTKALFTHDFASDFGPWGQVVEGDLLPYLAPHTGALGLTLEKDGVHWDVNARYTASMRAEAGQAQDFVGTDSAFIVDCGVRWAMGEHVQWRISGSNLFDEVYIASRRPFGVRPGAPRMLRLGCGWTF